MKLFHEIAETRAACRAAKGAGKLVALVPTMGALHEGHLSLVRAACREGGAVAVSIFVNPLQFGPKEDFSRYPRTLERDCQLLQAEGVDLVFAPAVEGMYPAGQQSLTVVEVADLSNKLEGKTRPGHFRGVTTVVSKLFHILEPDTAFFGQKDAQQALIIRRMAADLNMPTHVIICPTVREADGLAMSSRNVYLDPEQRRAATVLHRALAQVEMLACAGEQHASRLATAGRAVIGKENSARLDYFEVVHPESLDAIDDVSEGALILTAAYFGKTRLIDNLVLPGNCNVGSGEASQLDQNRRDGVLSVVLSRVH